MDRLRNIFALFSPPKGEDLSEVREKLAVGKDHGSILFTARHLSQNDAVFVGPSLSVIGDGFSRNESSGTLSRNVVRLLQMKFSEPNFLTNDQNIRRTIEEVIVDKETYTGIPSTDKDHTLGLTIVGHIITESEIILFWSGDSQTFAVTTEDVIELTEPHDLVWAMKENGVSLSEEDEIVLRNALAFIHIKRTSTSLHENVEKFLNDHLRAKIRQFAKMKGETEESESALLVSYASLFGGIVPSEGDRFPLSIRRIPKVVHGKPIIGLLSCSDGLTNTILKNKFDKIPGVAKSLNFLPALMKEIRLENISIEKALEAIKKIVGNPIDNVAVSISIVYQKSRRI